MSRSSVKYEDRYTDDLFFLCPAGHHDLHSFPTRRSSDLFPSSHVAAAVVAAVCALRYWARLGQIGRATSELQSHSDLVCRLLLEKKNQLPTVEVPATLRRPCFISCRPRVSSYRLRLGAGL